MFDLDNYFDRLSEWKNIRQQIQNSCDPVKVAVEYYEKAERHSLQYDPWKKDSWPTPWQLIDHNKYCSFSIILGIIYSCMLCDRFCSDEFSIIIFQLNTGEIGYTFSINNKIFNLDFQEYQILNVIPVEQKK